MKKLTLSFSIFLVILVAGAVHTFAQDTIYMKSSDKLFGKVQEIGINEIKYKDKNTPDGPVIVLRKSDVLKIKYENGHETVFLKDAYEVNQEVSVRNKSNAIKFEFLSPIAHNLGFAYERMLKVGTNLETKFGIIGPGLNSNEYGRTQSGAYVKVGVKFIVNKNDYVIDGLRYVHQLKGFYIKPEIIYNQFTLTSDQSGYYPYGSYSTYTEKVKYTNYAVNIVLGKQYILGNVMTFEYYGGIGYGGQSSSLKSSAAQTSPYLYSYASEYFENACYSHTFISNSLLITGGITLGVIF